MLIKYKLLILGFFLLVAFETIYPQSYKIIINIENELNSATKEEVSNYFLKKRTKWSNQTTIIPVDLISSSNVRIQFTEEIHGKTINQIRAFWQQSIFSGNATPPIELNSDLEIINFVKQNKGAIGYVSFETLTKGVNVLTIKGE